LIHLRGIRDQQAVVTRVTDTVQIGVTARHKQFKSPTAPLLHRRRKRDAPLILVSNTRAVVADVTTAVAVAVGLVGLRRGKAADTSSNAPQSLTPPPGQPRAAPRARTLKWKGQLSFWQTPSPATARAQ
jgi:hypothetical protein